MRAKSARLFGIFFILSFISYATGNGLMGIIQDVQAQPADIMESKFSLVAGAVLITFFHTLLNIGLLVVMSDILKPTNPLLSVIYLVLGSLGTLMLASGAIFLLLPISVSEGISQSNTLDTSFFSFILQLSSSGNFYSYHFGMAIWGIGGLILSYLLYKSRLVPVIFPICGYIGYSVFIFGCIFELFGLPYGVVLSVPGGLFEIGLSTWLIVKGFNNVTVLKKSNPLYIISEEP